MALDTQKQKRYKLSVPLVQMTPIYHFQADEAGATLRATEIKPKLDRYLIHAAFDDDPKQFSQYCIAKKDEYSSTDRNEAKRYALNYRLSISVDDSSSVLRKVDLATKTRTDRGFRVDFIGSIWDSVTLPAGTMLNQGGEITLHFYSRHPHLIEAIDEWIDAFFAGENFGRRQSKGFGSFVTYRSAQKHSDFDNALKKHISTTGWMRLGEIRIPFAMCEGTTTWQDALNNIRAIHKVLKSGENRPNPQNKKRATYIPSYLLKEYAKKNAKLQRFDNEKKTIKISTLQAINGVILPGRQSQESSRQGRRFLRAMLGLPQFYEFRKISVNGREYMARIGVSDSNQTHPSVERFRSPITYKPVCIMEEWRCYMIPQEIPEEMYSHFFDMQLVRSNDRFDIFSAKIVPPSTVTICTPSADEFNLLDLLTDFSAASRTIGIRFDRFGNKVSINCNFNHLTVKKEERPDE